MYIRESALGAADRELENHRLTQNLVQSIRSTALPYNDYCNLSRFVRDVSGGAVNFAQINEVRKKNIAFLESFLGPNPAGEDDQVDGVWFKVSVSDGENMWFISNICIFIFRCINGLRRIWKTAPLLTLQPNVTRTQGDLPCGCSSMGVHKVTETSCSPR